MARCLYKGIFFTFDAALTEASETPRIAFAPKTDLFSECLYQASFVPSDFDSDP